MSLPHADIDPNGLLEYSVVFTDRSLNHMSRRFVDVMQGIQSILCEAYHADTAVVVPGGGTYAMEAVARQLATGRRTLVIRNGLFSFRWSQILETGGISSAITVCTARGGSEASHGAWAPAPIEEVVSAIRDRGEPCREGRRRRRRRGREPGSRGVRAPARPRRGRGSRAAVSR